MKYSYDICLRMIQKCRCKVSWKVLFSRDVALVSRHTSVVKGILETLMRAISRYYYLLLRNMALCYICLLLLKVIGKGKVLPMVNDVFK